MKLASPKPWAVRQQRQERWRRDRAAAPTLRSGFPRVDRLRFDLTFKDSTPFVPAAQSHVLHPAAQAFFTFPCPYADCDGRFDLDALVKELLSDSESRGELKLVCAGSRVRGALGHQPCELHLHCIVSAHYSREE